MKAFLKWAGGKSRIAKEIKFHFKNRNRLVEPFVGSGALFLNTSFNKYLLCDTNADLINLYKNLKNFPDKLTAKTKEMFTKKNNTEDQFYIFREKFNKLKSADLEKSALFIYLNKHAFNGLCRYNSKGLFNVPYGRYKNPEFPEIKMYNFANKSQKATFKCQDFTKTFSEIKNDDVVYCDPPYVPLSSTSNFTSYSKNDFNLIEQAKLAECAKDLKSRQIQCIISNHDLDITRKLYKNSKIYKIEVQRNIASAAKSRVKVSELIAVF